MDLDANTLDELDAQLWQAVGSESIAEQKELFAAFLRSAAQDYLNTDTSGEEHPILRRTVLLTQAQALTDLADQLDPDGREKTKILYQGLRPRRGD